MLKNINTFLKELNDQEEFKFLNSTIELKSLIKTTILTFDKAILPISKVDKFPYVNYFIDDKESFFRLNNKISCEIYKTLFFETLLCDTQKLKKKILQALNYIIEKSNIEKVNKEILVFNFLVHKNIRLFNDNIFKILFQILLQKKLNKSNLSIMKLQYTDVSLKLGKVFLNTFLKTIIHKTIVELLKRKFIENKSSNLLEKHNNLNMFMYDTKNYKKNELINDLRKLFTIRNKVIANYTYKIIRSIYILNININKSILSTNFPKVNYDYFNLLLKFGCLLLESLSFYGLVSKNYKQLNKIKKQLVVKFNLEYIDFEAINLTIQRPYLIENTIKNILRETEIKLQDKISNKNVKNEYYNHEYSIELDLLNIFCTYRENYFISDNNNLTTTINNHTYLKSRKNLATKFVIDKDYLYYFLNLLRSHISSQKIDSKLTFIQKIDKHENILLLYQIPIDTLKTFYENHKNITYLKPLFNNILSYILNYNLKDFILMLDYTNLINDIQKQELDKKKQTIIINFISTLMNKINSYKEFIKCLLQECILFADFRYFIIDCFIDSRGRCYYIGFYLNPQSYPITKAFIKLYNPTRITERNYSDIILPTIQAHFLNVKYKNILTEKFDTYLKYLNEKQKLKENYLNSFLNTDLNIEIDVIQQFKNIDDDTKLSLEILNYIKPRIKKLKKIYVVHSMLIRILYERKEIQNYYELDATASGLQMTAMLFQNKELAEVSCLVNRNGYNHNDIYAQCSYLFIKKLDSIQCFIEQIFSETYNNYNSINNLLTHYINYRNKKINFRQLIKNIDKVINNADERFNNISFLKRFYKENKWIIQNDFKISGYNIKELSYMILLKGLKMNYLRKKLTWLNVWIESRDFCKKAIMTFGYNATTFRRKEEWLNLLLDLNNYKEKKDMFFICSITENFFNIIINTKLISSVWLRNLGSVITLNLKKNLLEKNFVQTKTMNVYIKNHYLNIQLHCYKQLTKRIAVKGLENKRKYQLNLKYFKYFKKTIKNDQNIPEIYLIKQQQYNLINRKFAPNFIHSMDAFLVHIFKEKLLHISKELKRNNIIINHMTNHDNFSLTLEPFLKVFLMDSYSFVYRYDYIQTLNSMDFFSNIEKFKFNMQQKYTKKYSQKLPGKYSQTFNKYFIYKPSEIELSSDFVK